MSRCLVSGALLPLSDSVGLCAWDDGVFVCAARPLRMLDHCACLTRPRSWFIWVV